MKHGNFIISAIAAVLLPMLFGTMAAFPMESKPTAAVWIITGLSAVCGVAWTVGRHAGYGVDPVRYFKKHVLMLVVSAACYTVIFAVTLAFFADRWYISAMLFGLLSVGLFAATSAVFLYGIIVKWNDGETRAVWEYPLWLLINPNLYAMIFMICYVTQLSAIYL